MGNSTPVKQKLDQGPGKKQRRVVEKLAIAPSCENAPPQPPRRASCERRRRSRNLPAGGLQKKAGIPRAPRWILLLLCGAGRREGSKRRRSPSPKPEVTLSRGSIPPKDSFGLSKIRFGRPLSHHQAPPPQNETPARAKSREGQEVGRREEKEAVSEERERDHRASNTRTHTHTHLSLSLSLSLLPQRSCSAADNASSAAAACCAATSPERAVGLGF